MRGRIWSCLAAIAVTLLMAERYSASADVQSGRSRALARQQVASALAHAMTHGRLASDKKDAILAMARQKLTPGEFESLQRTLSRLESPASQRPPAMNMPAPEPAASRRLAVQRADETDQSREMMKTTFIEPLRQPFFSDPVPGSMSAHESAPEPATRKPLLAPIPDDLPFGVPGEQAPLREACPLPVLDLQPAWGRALMPESIGHNSAPWSRQIQLGFLDRTHNGHWAQVDRR